MSETTESETTDSLLRTHRLVSGRWRIVRPFGEGKWHARPADHGDECPEECPCSRFQRVADALLWARTWSGGGKRL